MSGSHHRAACVVEDDSGEPVEVPHQGVLRLTDDADASNCFGCPQQALQCRSPGSFRRHDLMRQIRARLQKRDAADQSLGNSAQP